MRLFLTIIIAFVVGCSYGNTGRMQKKAKDSMPVTAQQTNIPKNNRPDCLNNIKGFLKWYKTNYERISKLQDETVALVGKGTASQYRVNFKNVEKYINALRASGYFSELFFQHKRQYFKKADEKLLKTKQNDGPPEGFEYDFILFTQEPEIILDNIDSLKLAVVQSGVIKLMVNDHNLLFSVNEKNDKCLFNDITFGRK